MKKSREMLRHRFEAESDIEIESQPADWKRYAEWLETVAIKELNNELVKDNELQRSAMRKAMNVLEKGIAGCPVKRRKKGAKRKKPLPHKSRRL